MHKICFITQGELPVPAKKGGAVETLVQYIIEKNEISHDFDIDVITVDDESINNIEYKHTNLLKVSRGNANVEKCWNFIYRVLKKVFKIYIPYSVTSKRILNLLKDKNDAYDYVIYEAGPTTQIPLISKYIDKEKLLVHVHWDGCSNRRIDKHFAHLIPVSRYIANVWEAGCDRTDDGVRILRNCAPVEYFSKHIGEEEKENLRKELGIDSSKKIIIFTGRIVWEKGVLELIRSLQLLNDKDICLLIIGSANFGNKTFTGYEKQVKELVDSVDFQVVFTGFVHQTKLYQYYDIADIAIMPSQFQDPAPLVSIETQATGTALIATRVGGIPEYVTPESAILVDKDEHQVENLAKEISELLKDSEKREKMGRAGIENSSKYTVSHFYNDFVNLIKGLE